MMLVDKFIGWAAGRARLAVRVVTFDGKFLFHRYAIGRNLGRRLGRLS